MSVLIKGMEMPDKCAHCRCATAFDCTITGSFISTHSIRQPDCPLVPVPEHGDLIDRDTFIEFIKTHWDRYDQWFVEQLEARPTVIPASEEGE